MSKCHLEKAQFTFSSAENECSFPHTFISYDISYFLLFVNLLGKDRGNCFLIYISLNAWFKHFSCFQFLVWVCVNYSFPVSIFLLEGEFAFLRINGLYILNKWILARICFKQFSNSIMMFFDTQKYHIVIYIYWSDACIFVSNRFRWNVNLYSLSTTLWKERVKMKQWIHSLKHDPCLKHTQMTGKI